MPQNIICSQCGEPHYKKPGEIAKSKSGNLFCSMVCYGAYNSAPDPICPICSGPITGNQKLKKKTCSRSCSNKSRTGIVYDGTQKNNKAAQNRTLKRWLISRRGGTCEICEFANTNILVVHHKIEKSMGGSNDLDNLLLICPNCHAEIHYG